MIGVKSFVPVFKCGHLKPCLVVLKQKINRFGFVVNPCEAQRDVWEGSCVTQGTAAYLLSCSDCCGLVQPHPGFWATEEEQGSKHDPRDHIRGPFALVLLRLSGNWVVLIPQVVS